MPTTDGLYDAPAYCANCDRPIAVGPVCEACLEPECEHENVSPTASHPGGWEYEVCEDCGAEWRTNRKDSAT